MEASEGRLAMKWAMVCSVEKEADLAQFREFGCWFSAQLNAAAPRLGIYVFVDEEPTLVQWAKPGDMQAVTSAYEKIHDEFPCCQLVVHILPKDNSDEYHWMKSLSARFAVIRQGILAENALSRFTNSTASSDEAIANIAQWVSRRAAEIARGRNTNDRPFNIRVGEAGTEPIFIHKGFPNQYALVSAVNTVLHGGGDAGDASQHGADAMVRVSGFPQTMNDFAIASIFSPLTVVAVSQQTEKAEAVVTLSNKFHALQAAALYDKKTLDRYHTLNVVPISPIVAAQLAVA